VIIHQITSCQVKKNSLGGLSRFLFFDYISDFIIKVEQIPNPWATDIINERSNKDHDDNNKKV
jgi:hypothetical protein